MYCFRPLIGEVATKMWMVYISLEEKHKAESLGTPVRDLAQGIMGASVKTLEKGSLNSLNGTKDKMNVTCFFLLLFLKKLNVKGRSGRSLRMLSSKKSKKENQDPKALLTESHLWRMRHTKVVLDLVQLHHKNHLQVQRFLLFVLLI